LALSLALAVVLALSLSLALRPPLTPPSSPEDECSWPFYRLPLGRVQPLSYSVFWDISSALAAPFPFSGTVEVQLQLAAGVRCVLLHSKDLALSSMTAALDAPGSSSFSLAYQPDLLPFSERVIVALPQALQGPQRLRLKVGFSGNLSSTAIGFYASSYTNGTLRVPLVQTKFEPSFARTAFPCLDEPALKANFSLSLRGVPPSYTALSNMPALGPVVSGAVSFSTSPRMSTYQLTFVVAPMRSVAGTLPQGGEGIPLTCWTMDRGSASYLPGCSFATTTGIATLAYYTGALGVPFPLPKMDLVYLPVFPVGAMEQWGLVTYIESYLSSGASGSASAGGVVAHELAHQNFGNLVTADFWDSLWLQEGFATFWPNLVLPVVAPALQYEVAWRSTTAGAMAEDAFAASQALTVSSPVTSSGASYAVFNTITYDKGAAAIHSLQRRLEALLPGSFLAGLRAYLTSKAYSAAVPNDLLSSLAAAAGLSSAQLGAEFAALLFQPGVPLVTAQWAAGGGGLELTQARFFASPYSAAAAVASPPPALWSIPLTIDSLSPSAPLSAAAQAAAAALAQSGGYASPSLLPAPLNYSLTPGNWLTLHNGSAGEYYRVQYPLDVYEQQAASFAAGLRLPPPSALAVLIDDLFSLSQAGYKGLNTSYALSWAARWVGKSSAQQVTDALTTHASRVFQLLLTDDVPLSGGGAPSLKPRAATPGTPEFACSQAFLQFCTQRLGLPASLASSLNSSLLVDRAALNASLSGPMDAANASSTLTKATVCGARDLGWRWLTGSFPLFTQLYGQRSTLATLVRSAARSFGSLEYAPAVASFFAQQGRLFPVVEGTWQRAVESIQANAAWQDRDRGATCAYLQGLQPAAALAGTAGSASAGAAGQRGSSAAAGGEDAWAGERLQV
jgi:hypothetical protein